LPQERKGDRKEKVTGTPKKSFQALSHWGGASQEGRGKMGLTIKLRKKENAEGSWG